MEGSLIPKIRLPSTNPHGSKAISISQVHRNVKKKKKNQCILKFFYVLSLFWFVKTNIIQISVKEDGRDSGIQATLLDYLFIILQLI